ncbi:MAG: hypothetical protein J0I06_24400 [Planctomycetes bacterium]|nr:hypothetical protein [Planctomycetota bacterium]
MNARATGAVPLERTRALDDLPAHVRNRPPTADVPRVAVSGNAGVRTRAVVKAARPGSAKLGSYRYDRPPIPLNTSCLFTPEQP